MLNKKPIYHFIIALLAVTVIAGCGSDGSYQAFISHPERLQSLFKDCQIEAASSFSKRGELCALVQQVEDPEQLKLAVFKPEQFGKKILAVQSDVVKLKQCFEASGGEGCPATDEERQKALVQASKRLTQYFATLRLLHLLIGR